MRPSIFKNVYQRRSINKKFIGGGLMEASKIILRDALTKALKEYEKDLRHQRKRVNIPTEGDKYENSYLR